MRKSLLLAFALASLAQAANYPAPVEGDWVIRDFQFHSGESLPELRLHYYTVGDKTGQPVLLLHGTNGSGRGFLNEAFGGEMFGSGQPLDAATHYVIMPDGIGSGKSSKPSDGLRAKFPHYNYDDMVRAQYRLVTEGLGVRHLRVVLGNSMGGMHAWTWGEMYPDSMDVLVPMASSPIEMSGRNWIMRRMIIDAIRNDPEWNGGNYSEQPRGFRQAQVYFGFATSGGTQAIYRTASTRQKADEIIERQMKGRAEVDANDALYGYEASRDYNPSADLEKIQARVLAINSQDDERNPAELGVMEAGMKRIRNGHYILIPTGPETRGHGTTSQAKLWKAYLAEELNSKVSAAGR